MPQSSFSKIIDYKPNKKDEDIIISPFDPKNRSDEYL